MVIGLNVLMWATYSMWLFERLGGSLHSHISFRKKGPLKSHPFSVPYL